MCLSLKYPVILYHALCRIHDGRHYEKLAPLPKNFREQLEDFPPATGNTITSRPTGVCFPKRREPQAKASDLTEVRWNSAHLPIQRAITTPARLR